MIPLSLRLRNFLSYGENVPTLSFAGFHIACLSGDNGHGKSALLDALTWALWGKARAKSDDDLIHLGRAEMEVEFAFLLGEEQYRVLRRRARPKGRGRAGQSLLELHIAQSPPAVDQGYRSLTGNSLGETQRKITELLRMDYDTFINSAFLLQGRADEFTVKTPSERKAVLAEILGLTYYDRLEERARAVAKEREQEGGTLRARLEEYQREAVRRPEYEAERREAESVVGDLEGQVRGLEANLQALRRRQGELAVLQREHEDALGRQKAAQGELEAHQKRVAAHRTKVEEYQELLRGREKTEQGYRELLQARQEDEAWTDKLRLLYQLQGRQGQLQQSVERAKGELQTQVQLLSERVSQWELRAAGVEHHRKELQEVQEHLKALATEEEALARERLRSQELQVELHHLQSHNEQVKQEGQLLREKLQLLAHAEATCPVCGQALAEEGRQRLQRSYQVQIQEQRQLYVANEGRSRTLRAELELLQRQVQKEEARLARERAARQADVALLGQRIQEGEQAQAELLRSQGQLQELEGRLARGDYALAEQEELAAVQRDMAALGYSSEEHGALRRRLETLQAFEERQRRLEEATRLLAREEEALAQAEAEVGRWSAVAVAEADRAQALAGELAAAPALAQGLAQAEAALQGLRHRLEEARQWLGQAQERLEHCQRQEELRRDAQAKLEEAAREQAIYEELALAFGKRGIQALIIEAAIPEIEEEANRLLSRMTDSRMHVTLETQRDLKRGDTVETLEIRIADELGTRPYELYSGGEAFRVNFALRVALSKLLARRAGARLQTLVMDEGFGTQDSAGREKLLDAINAVRDDFEKILVITHLEEIKEAFPVRIEVTKGPEGSMYTVS